MLAIPLAIPDVVLLEPKFFRDERGFFFESFNQKQLNTLIARELNFVQDNHSHSTHNVLRGLHYQSQHPQGKLVRVSQGRIFDVAVDIRRNSSNFGRWVGAELSAENKHQLWIPEGFAHGFLVLSETADVLYKTTDYYAPEHEKIILWNDSTIGIDWGLGDLEPTLSCKDKRGSTLVDFINEEINKSKQSQSS